jgi:hypothetical protein
LQFSYTAKDPTVNGALPRPRLECLASVTPPPRRHGANPLAGDITRIYTEVNRNRRF